MRYGAVPAEMQTNVKLQYGLPPHQAEVALVHAYLWKDKHRGDEGVGLGLVWAVFGVAGGTGGEGPPCAHIAIWCIRKARASHPGRQERPSQPTN